MIPVITPARLEDVLDALIADTEQAVDNLREVIASDRRVIQVAIQHADRRKHDAQIEAQANAARDERKSMR